jgi:hypothetical protein
VVLGVGVGGHLQSAVEYDLPILRIHGTAQCSAILPHN